MKKIFGLLLASCMLLSLLTACGSSSGNNGGPSPTTTAKEFEPVVWKLSHTRKEDSRAGIAIQKFADTVKEATNGNIAIEIYGSSSLGDYSTVQERVSMGDIQMQMSDLSTNIDSSLIVPTVPYLLSSWDDVTKYTTVSDGGILVDFLQERLSEQNITLLNNYPQYFASVCSTKEIQNYKDPTANKELKMRVPTSVPFEKLGNLFGFSATPMASSECYTSMQTGVIDGVIGGGTEYYYSSYNELVKYILPINTHYVCYWICINSEAYNSLPAEYQQIITDALNELHDQGLEDAMAETTTYEDKFRDEGATIYELTDEEVAAYADAYRSEVWPTLGTDILGDGGLEILQQFAGAYGVSMG